VNKEKGTKEDQLLYKTIDRLEKRDKGRFWFSVLIFSSIVLAITTVLSLGYSLNQKRETERQELQTAKLRAELEKLRAEKELKEMAEEVVSVIARQGETEFAPLSSNKQSILESRLSQIAVRADNILSEKNAGNSFKDTLFVWSHVGLNIRDQPDEEESEVFWGFPFGTPLHVLQDAKPQSDTFPLSVLGGRFDLEGAYVVLERDTIRGYGYSGLLSPLPAFISAKDLQAYYNLASRNPALIDQFGLELETKSGRDITLKTKNLSLQEVFLLVRNVYGFDHLLRTKEKVTNVSQSDNEWSLIIGEYTVRIFKTSTGVNASVVSAR
jgi:hypothetical protein